MTTPPSIQELPSGPMILKATGNLDSKTTDEILNIFEKANKKYNQTLIIITHNIEIAKKADRIITIKDGKIISDEGKN